MPPSAAMNDSARNLGVAGELQPGIHIRKFQLIKGDASQTARQWMDDNPHAIVSMRILDMDVYQPTVDVLTAFKERLTKGSMIVFDDSHRPIGLARQPTGAKLRHTRLLLQKLSSLPTRFQQAYLFTCGFRPPHSA